MPLVRSFTLSTKSKTWAEPIVEPGGKSVRFEIRSGKGEAPEGTIKNRKARCLACGTIVGVDHIKKEGTAGRMGSQLMAIVAEGLRGRRYLSPSNEHVQVALRANPPWKPDQKLPYDPRNFWTLPYGMTSFSDLFTSRQLTALCTFSDLIPEVQEMAYNQALKACMNRNDVDLAGGGKGAKAYSEAIGVYLAIAVDKLADRLSTICSWDSGYVKIRNTFARQAIPMSWDYAEGNPFSSSTGNWSSCVEWGTKVLQELPSKLQGCISNQDATKLETKVPMLFSTDPPYYDNIGYADLSDFFYVWLKKNLINIYPSLFRTIMTPKTDELVATPFRFDGDKDKAKEHFESGFSEAFAIISRISHEAYPISVYYAFKQSEIDDDGNGEMVAASTGWETMLEGLIKNEFSIIGTWPMRSELSNRPIAQGTNALASSIVIVCRPKEESAQLISRKDFMIALRKELPWALDNLREGGIAPVDLAQAAIGPGMAVYSKFKAVLEADGSKMSVRTALGIINQELEIWLTSLEGELDKDTRFCVAWFEQFGMNEAPFGEADVLARAKNTATGRIEDKGLIKSLKGKVRLVGYMELSGDIVPGDDLSIWMCVQHMLKALNETGETGVAEIVEKVGASKAEAAKALAYRLYKIAEDKKLTEDALAYNSLVSSWMDIKQRAEEISRQPSKQGRLI